MNTDTERIDRISQKVNYIWKHLSDLTFLQLTLRIGDFTSDTRLEQRLDNMIRAMKKEEE